MIYKSHLLNNCIESMHENMYRDKPCRCSLWLYYTHAYQYVSYPSYDLFLKSLHQNIDYFANELSLHQMYDCHISTLINLRFVCTLKKKEHRSRHFDEGFACYIWKHHHCWWRVSKFRLMLAAYGLWAVRDLYSAPPAVTWELGFVSLI